MDKICKAHQQGKVQPLIIILLLMIVLMIIAVHRFITPTIVSVEVARFANNATAAYSLIHDDLCSSTDKGILAKADTIAFNRGIRFGTAAIVADCEKGGDTLWDRVQTLVNHGHEIISHGWDHGPAVATSDAPKRWSYDTAVVLSKKVLETHLKNVQVTWFVFPYDAYTEENLEELKRAGYVGARAGDEMYKDRGVNGQLQNFNPFKTNFDIYMSSQEQKAILASDNPYTVSTYTDLARSVAEQHVEAAIAVEGWSLQEMHTVAMPQDSIWGSITETEYRSLMDYLVEKRKSRELWIETPSRVARYIVTRNGLGKAELDNGVVRFPTAKVAPQNSTEVSLLVTTSKAPKKLFAVQNGTRVEAEKIAENRFLVSYTPGMTLSLSLK